MLGQGVIKLNGGHVTLGVFVGLEGWNRVPVSQGYDGIDGFDVSVGLGRLGVADLIVSGSVQFGSSFGGKVVVGNIAFGKELVDQVGMLFSVMVNPNGTDIVRATSEICKTLRHLLRFL